MSPAAGAGRPSIRRFEGRTVFVTGASRGIRVNCVNPSGVALPVDAGMFVR